jgi:uncharacterized protein (UPF0261 family)
MRKTIAIVATLDTKGDEVKYLKEQIERRGKDVLIIDTGLRGAQTHIKADITRETLAEAAGSTIEEVGESPRGAAIEVMVKGIVKVFRESYDRGMFHGIMAIGGLDGALLASEGMRVLPLGVPKLIVTPVAGGNVTFGTFVGTSDMIMMHSVIDILGINEISKKVFDTAVGAMIGILDMDVSPTVKKKNLIATTMYGNTTPAVMTAKKLIEDRGYEVLVFHPNGTGGRAMEELIERGLFTAVLDMTPHEITDELLGGVHAAGPDRLEGAGRKGIPQVVVPGCIDFMLMGPFDTLPEKYKKRKYYKFNPAVTMVRISSEEMVSIGKLMAEKLNKAVGPTQVVIPWGGFNMYCHKGESLYDPEADRIFIETLKKHLKSQIKVVEVDAHINDPLFAEKAVSVLMEILELSSTARQ